MRTLSSSRVLSGTAAARRVTAVLLAAIGIAGLAAAVIDGGALVLVGLAAAALAVAAAGRLPVLRGGRGIGRWSGRQSGRDPATGLLRRDSLDATLDRALHRSARRPETVAAISLEINDFRLLEERYDRAEIEHLYRAVGERLCRVLRAEDRVARLEGPVFAVALSPVRRLDLPATIQLCARLQQAVAQPIPMGMTSLYLTCSAGFCLSERLDKPTGEAMLQGAGTAMIEAMRSGPGAVRGFSDAMRRRIRLRSSLSEQVAGALETGEITAFFQPQVATPDRRLTGFEALARWNHPERGMIPPIEFLPAFEEAGLTGALGLHVIEESLAALRHWDAAGFCVPRVAVNFSGIELRNPGLVDHLSRELDRFGLSPDRVAVEVMETVVAGQADDQILRTLSGLSRLGCTIDLDDFGTGHASITNIRRFSIGRIKIDRSFVTRIDEDPDQQMMLAAILTMAERLNLGTVAEGVETPGEMAMLAELGCAEIQGFVIARPMPLTETDAWIRSHAGGVIEPLRRRPA